MNFFKKETEDNTILDAYKANTIENENKEIGNMKALIEYHLTLKDRPYINDKDVWTNISYYRKLMEEQEKLLDNPKYKVKPGNRLIDVVQVEVNEIIIKICEYNRKIRVLTKAEKKYYKELIKAGKNQNTIMKRKIEYQINKAKRQTPEYKAKQAQKARNAKQTELAAGIAFLRHYGGKRRRWL
jgi:hypothetical protein